MKQSKRPKMSKTEKKMVLNNQTTHLKKQLHTKRGEINSSRPEYTKNKAKINQLEIKEANSSRAIVSEIQRFKTFLDNVSS